MNFDTLTAELEQFTEKANRKLAESDARFLAIEQRMTSPHVFASGDPDTSLGQKLIESEQYKSFQIAQAPRTGKIRFDVKTALVNSALGSNLLVAADRRAIVDPIVRRLTVADC